MLRRNFLKAGGVFLALPHFASQGNSKTDIKFDSKVKSLVSFGNGFGFNPESFFPKTHGRNYELSELLKPLVLKVSNQASSCL